MTKLVTYVALLRGINVGGNNKISMAELRVCFEKLGYANVTSYINSGNIIFKTPKSDPRKLEAAIEAAIEKTFKLPISVQIRSMDDIHAAMAGVPKSWHTNKDQKCNVIFLAHSIDSPGILKNFAPKPDIEELHYKPGVLYWSAFTTSITKSAMLKVSSMPIYKQMTIRVYSSALKLYAMMQRVDEQS